MTKGFVAVLILLAAGGMAQAQSTSAPNPAAAPGPGAQSDGPTRATGTGAGSAQSASAAKPLASDQKFFKKAAMAGLSEVAAGNVAARQSSNQKVKDFAQQMVSDHGSANEGLQQLAQQKGIPLPTAPDAKQKKALDALAQKQGADFDHAYIEQQVKDHKQAVSLFKTAAKSQDPDVQAFAQKTLPTLEHHLEMAEQLKTST